MNFLKKYLGDPDLIEYLDFERATPYEFDLEGQKMTFLSPEYASGIGPDGSSSQINFDESFWSIENSNTGPYQYLYGCFWNIFNKKLFNKERQGGISLSCSLRYRPNNSALLSFNELYQHTSHVIAEYYRKNSGGSINRQKGKWTHEVTYSQSEKDFILLKDNGINWLCGYQLSEGFIENSFYQTLLNQDVIIELRFSRSVRGSHEMQTEIINALNAAERDFIRHFKLEAKDNTLAIQNMLAEQYKGKVLTLDDIGGASERVLLEG